MAQRPILRASEIGEYAYCHRSWWLRRVQGAESSNRLQMEAGIVRHLAHGRRLRNAEQLWRAGLIVLVLAALGAAVVIALLAGLFP